MWGSIKEVILNNAVEVAAYKAAVRSTEVCGSGGGEGCQSIGEVVGPLCETILEETPLTIRTI